MGNYNPNLPVILGQEWVPIRDESVAFSPRVNNVERGSRFSLATSRQTTFGAYYVHGIPAQDITTQATMLSVYPAGREGLSGPIESVLIPVSSGATTGSGVSFFGTSIADALLYPGDLKFVTFSYIGGLQQMNLFFPVPDYAQLLAGKRILNVGFVYAGAARINTGTGDEFINPDPTFSATSLYRRNNSGTTLSYFRFFGANTGALWQLNTKVSPAAGVAEFGFGEVNLGDANPWYDNTISPTAGLIYPWRFEELLRFGSAPSDRQNIHIVVQVPDLDNGSSNTQVILSYAALKVTYCNEERVAYGGKFGAAREGINPVALRDTTLTANPTLAAGDYSMVASMLNPGDISFGQGASAPSPDFNGLRQVYPLETHPGVQVNIPFPLDDHIGDTFELEESDVLPQLSLHLSAGTTLTEPHAYGRQIAAEVWGTKYAQQETLDTPVGVSTPFPWVRFYARRFGETTVPLSITGQAAVSGSAASITPDEFDELEEVLDGWKEVTLRFDTPPNMGTIGDPSWRFTATGELAGNRWEVLGASAPALSGTPGNLYNLAPSAWQSYFATYSAPTGDQQELQWVPQGVGSPPVSGVGVNDDSTDLFLIFAQEPPAVSGFGVEVLCQPVTGIGQECDVDPCCIPTNISFNQLSWDTVLPIEALDDFDRTTAPGSWNGLSGGGTWSVAGGTVGTDYYVANGMGTHLVDSSTTTRRSTVDGSSALDVSLFTQISFNAIPSTGELTGGVMMLYVDGDNYYMVEVSIMDTGTIRLRLRKRQTTNTTLVTVNNALYTYAVGQILNVRAERVGSTIRAKVWFDGTDEPTGWQISVVDTSFTAAGQVGLRSLSNTGTVISDFSVNYHYFEATDLQFFGSSDGFFEIQRMDTVDTDWATIMLGDVSVTTFNDFEARVGIETSYRIRTVDSYGFEGEWSDTITATIDEPGVTIGCEGGHLLIFTSNERQDGSINLAYSSVWMDQQVQEDFVFPESTFKVLQPMYGRDFFTAFSPMERGGEQFSRTLLVQAAAISPPTLGDFRELRDMAWEAVNYICVRDEEGNRWFATIGVPSGRVINNRRLYLAPVNIGEVTQTPTPVNPADAAVAGTVTGVPIIDTFTRSVSSDWGTADTGQVWTREGGSASEYGVDGTAGWHDAGFEAATRRTLMDGPADGLAVWTTSTPETSSGEAAQANFIVREDGTNDNFLVFRILFFPSGEVELRISIRVAGVETTLANPAGTQDTYTPNAQVHCKCLWLGSYLAMKVWVDADPEPEFWQASAVDSTFLEAGRMGFRSSLGTDWANWTGTVPLRISYHDFEVQPLSAEPC